MEATFPLSEAVGGMVLCAVFNIVGTFYLVRAAIARRVCGRGAPCSSDAAWLPRFDWAAGDGQVGGAYIPPRAMNWLLFGAVVSSAGLLVGAREKRKRLAVDATRGEPAFG